MSFDISFIKRNRLYLILLCFVLTVNLLAFLPGRPERSEDKALSPVISGEYTPVETSPAVLSENDLARRQERLQALAEQDPALYFFLVALNLTILFVAFSGILIDVGLLIRTSKGHKIDIKVNDPPPAKWSIKDVVRVVLIFVSAGYAAVFLQVLLARKFPLFGNENFMMVMNTALMNIVGIGVILYFVTKKYGQAPDSIGLTTRGGLKNVFYALTGYIGLIPVLLTIMIITYMVSRAIGYTPPPQPIVEVFMEEKETAVIWFSMAFAAVFGPVAEEIFFRGFVYGALRKKIGVFWSILTTAAVFALLHSHLAGFLPIMALGVLLAYLFERTGSLAASITVHIIHNVGMLLLVFFIKNIT